MPKPAQTDPDEKVFKTTYEEDPDLSKAVTQILTNRQLQELEPLQNNEIIVLCCMKTVMNGLGETKPCRGPAAQVKKIPPELRIFIPGFPHYVLTMDYGFWNKVDDRQRWAAIFDALLDIDAKLKPDGVKLTKRASDVPFKHIATVTRFGAHNEPSLLLRQAYRDASHRLTEFIREKNESAEELEVEPEPEPNSPKKPA